MAHDVRFSIPEGDLGRADICFRVKLDRNTLGELKVSRGSVVWFQRDASYGYRLTWRRFDEEMKKIGIRQEKR